jgi:hypothetical protein
MPRTSTRPILVTGTQRSGSTFVGHMIATHPRVVYLWEPFNREVPRTPARYWYHHVTPEDQQPFRAFLDPYLTLRYPWWASIKERVHPRRIAGSTIRTPLFWYRRVTGCRPLMKDPSALFSAEWLADTYGMDVVVLIRHPAAFASSLKRLNWPFHFTELTQQPRLMQDYLEPFQDEVHRAVERPPDILGQAMLVWRVIHHVIRRFQCTHPNWIFLRHEDLSRRPQQGFEDLFARLGLDMLPRVRQAIQAHTSAANPKEARAGVVHQLHRDSLGNIWNWRSRLRPDEIARLREGTHDVARFFYTDADWEGEPDDQRRTA